MTAAQAIQCVPMIDARTGASSYAIWAGEGRDPKNPSRLLSPRLLTVKSRKPTLAQLQSMASNL